MVGSVYIYVYVCIFREAGLLYWYLVRKWWGKAYTQSCEGRESVCLRGSIGFSWVGISKQRFTETNKQDTCLRDNEELKSKPLYSNYFLK